jgi:hypothetical protein
MIDITADFLADWYEMQKAALCQMGYVPSPDDTQDKISLAFYNLERRMISMNRRTVHQSRELTCPVEDRPGLNDVLKKAAKGSDLRPHQSTKLLQADYDDALLNDWRIQHLHLGTAPHKKMPGFMSRTGAVLYAYITAEEFFAINVLDHTAFAQQRLLQIIHRNWPKLIEPFRAKGTLGLEFNPSDDDIKIARHSFINAATEIDGAVYMSPGGGYASNGTSAEVVFRHDNARELFLRVQDYIARNIDQLAEQQRSIGPTMVPPYHFKLNFISPDRLEVIEVNSRAILTFGLGSWQGCATPQQSDDSTIAERPVVQPAGIVKSAIGQG